MATFFIIFQFLRRSESHVVVENITDICHVSIVV